MIYNAGVEVGTGAAPDYWSTSSWVNDGDLEPQTTFSWVSGGAHSGNRSVRVDVSNYTSGDRKWVPMLVGVTGGTYYTFSDWYKSDASTSVSVYYLTADPLDPGHWANLYTGIPPASQWTQYTTGFTMPADAVMAYFVHFLPGNGYLQTDDYSMKESATPPGFSKAMVSLTFDDGSQEFYDRARPILDSHGFKTTQYIPTAGLSPQDLWMMTPREIKQLADQGHEIGSHSITHPDLTTLSDAQLEQELEGSRAELEAIPLPHPVLDFAYPFGAYDARVIQGLEAAGYRSGRSVEPGYNSKLDLEPYDIRVQNMTRTTTLAEFQSWVDYAKAHGYWLVIVYHEVVADGLPDCPADEDSASDPCVGLYYTTESRFRDQLNAIAQSGLDVVPAGEAFRRAEAEAHAPVAGTVALTPSPATTDATLTATPDAFADPDGGSLAYTYRWLVNGTAVAGATGASFDLSKPGHGDRGDVVRVEVTAGDGAHQSGAATAEATIANTAPVAGSVTLAPSAPLAGSALTASPAGFSDADREAIGYVYAWVRDGQPLTGRTAATLPGSLLRAGDTIRVSVRAVDGHGGTSAAATASVVVHATAASPVDRIAPVINVRSPKPLTYRRGRKLTIKFTCSDTSRIAKRTATLRRRGGGTRAVHYGSRVRLTKTGRYVLKITAVDGKGNVATKVVRFRVTSH